jgi:hypothetical protein
MVWPGCGSVPVLVRLGMHNCFNTLGGLCTVSSVVLAERGAPFSGPEWARVVHGNGGPVIVF